MTMFRFIQIRFWPPYRSKQWSCGKKWAGNIIIDADSINLVTVRAASFKTMINLLNCPLIYSEVYSSLKYYHEIVCRAALCLICVFHSAYCEIIVILPCSDGGQLDLVVNASAEICCFVTNLCLRARTIACQLFGTMTEVSSFILEQTLYKLLMSTMTMKRLLEVVRSEEWSCGKKWAVSAPHVKVGADSVNLFTSGSCDVFVCGLENEFLEVPSAGVDAFIS